MGKYFKTDGYRGVAGKEITSYTCYKIGQFLGRKYKGGRIVVGKDTRLSSYMIEYSIVSGIISCGTDCALMHVCTTPAMSFIVRQDRFDCAVMISASHNQFFDNGIKIFDSKGEKIGEDVIADLERFMEEDNYLPDESGEYLGKVEDYYHGRNRYIAFLTTLSDHSFNGLKIGLDTANGSTYMIAKCAFCALGATVYAINDNPNGTNINLNCGSTNIDALKELVKKEGLDMGFAFDGDGDRCIAVDENGEEVDGDKILYVLAQSFKEEGKLYNNSVVSTVMSNKGLEIALNKIGVNLLKSKVGDRFVYEMMEQNECVLGGESSGHTIIGMIERTGDGIATAIELARICAKKKALLSVLTKPINLFPRSLINVPLPKDLPQGFSVKALEEIISKYNDGTLFILLRKSGTESVIRALIEGENEQVVKNISKIVQREIEEYVNQK